MINIKAEAQSSALELGDDLYAKGNFSKAIKAHLSYEDSTAVFNKIAKSYQALGLTQKALVYFEKSYDANSEDELIMYNYAKMLFSSKKYAKASELFEKLIYKDYKNPHYHYQKGLVLEKIPDSLDKAIDRFNSAFRLDTGHQKSIIKLATHYLKKGKHKSVDYFLKFGLENNANSLPLLSLKAQNFYYKDDYLNAIIWFEKLLELGESSEFIHEKLSRSYGKEYEYEKAIMHRKEVLKYNPYDFNSKYVIGQYYQRLEQHGEAVKWFKEYFKSADLPLDNEYSDLGVSLNYQKKHKEAIEAFNKSLRENPSNFLVQFWLVTTKEAYYKDIDAKIKLYEDFILKYPAHKMLRMAEHRLSELKKEKFLKKD